MPPIPPLRRRQAAGGRRQASGRQKYRDYCSSDVRREVEKAKDAVNELARLLEFAIDGLEREVGSRLSEYAERNEEKPEVLLKAQALVERARSWREARQRRTTVPEPDATKTLAQSTSELAASRLEQA